MTINAIPSRVTALDRPMMFFKRQWNGEQRVILTFANTTGIYLHAAKLIVSGSNDLKYSLSNMPTVRVGVNYSVACSDNYLCLAYMRTSDAMLSCIEISSGISIFDYSYPADNGTDLTVAILPDESTVLPHEFPIDCAVSDQCIFFSRHALALEF